MEIKSNSVEELFKNVSTGKKHKFTDEESIEFIKEFLHLQNREKIQHF